MDWPKLDWPKSALTISTNGAWRLLPACGVSSARALCHGAPHRRAGGRSGETLSRDTHLPSRPHASELRLQVRHGRGCLVEAWVREIAQKVSGAASTCGWYMNADERHGLAEPFPPHVAALATSSVSQEWLVVSGLANFGQSNFGQSHFPCVVLWLVLVLWVSVLCCLFFTCLCCCVLLCVVVCCCCVVVVCCCVLLVCVVWSCVCVHVWFVFVCLCCVVCVLLCVVVFVCCWCGCWWTTLRRTPSAGPPKMSLSFCPLPLPFLLFFFSHCVSSR